MDAEQGQRGFRGFRVAIVGLVAAGCLWLAPTAMAAITFTQAPPNPDNDATPTFQWNDPAFPAATFQCRLNLSGGFSACASGHTPTVPERNNNVLEVRRTGVAGSVVTHTWGVDLTDPNVSMADRQTIPMHGSNPTYSCSDPNGGSPAWNSGIDSCTDSGFNNEDLGPHVVTVTATDNAGNEFEYETVYVVVPVRYGDLVLDDDPVAYYRHNEAYPSAQTPQEIEMLDSSGNDYHGTYKNNVALGRQGAINCTRRPHPPRACEFLIPAPPYIVDDPENKAAFFPERDGYGYVNGIPSSPTGYTMEAWIKPDTSGPMMVMSHGRAGQLFIDHNQRLAFEQSQDTVSSPGPNIPVGSWTHVAATWDGNNTRLYVNGIQVAHSTTANKTPSGTSTFYVGYGEKAPWFHGDIDESALYDYALSQHRLHDRWKTGTAKDEPSVPGHDLNSRFNTGQPFTDPNMPKNNGLYAPGKIPVADFECTDPDSVPSVPPPGLDYDDIASCTATVQKIAGAGAPGPVQPLADGGALPDGLGQYNVVITATDKGVPANVYVHTHTYFVRAFMDIYKTKDVAELTNNGPLAYYRLGEPSGASEMFDSSDNDYDGEYKNGVQSSAAGISGDGNFARDFDGSDAYGYANDIHAPNYQTTLEAWVHPDNLHRDQSIIGHGDGGELYIEGGVYKFRHGSQNRVVTASPPYAGNLNSSFTQVVGTWDGVDLRIYVNGELEGTTESNRGPTSASTFYVAYGEIKPWFDGRLDEIAYYGIALSGNRVKQHFLADPAADDSGPVGGGSGGGGGGGDTGGGSTGGDTGGDTGGGETGGSAGDDGSGDPADPSGDDAKAAELQKCLKRAYKIGNKKKRHKAVKKCRQLHG